jgi:hypothetical protein
MIENLIGLSSPLRAFMAGLFTLADSDNFYTTANYPDCKNFERRRVVEISIGNFKAVREARGL